jgi:KDO2-lipid IV(A) lauroyltransferase
MLAGILGTITFIIKPELRYIVSSNISRVLGQKAANNKLNKTVRGVLGSTFKNYLDLVRLRRISREEIVRAVTVTGRHHLDKALERGKGVILFTAHLGSFDTALQIFCTYPTQVTVVVEPINPPALLNYVTARREILGVNILPAKTGALKQMIKILRKGEILLFALDRDTTSAGVKSRFFSKDTSMPAEAIKIAMRTGAAIVPIFNNRCSNDSYNVYIEPEVDVIRTIDGALEQNVASISRVMEKFIGRFPDQWVVLEPIWNDN